MKKFVSLSVQSGLLAFLSGYSPKGLADPNRFAERMNQIERELKQSENSQTRTINNELGRRIQETINRWWALKGENDRLRKQLQELKRQHPTQGQQNWNKIKEWAKKNAREPREYDSHSDGK